MLVALAFAVLAATPAPDSAWGVIRGMVQSDPSGLPVARAVIEAESPAGLFMAMADSTGAYRLQVPAGRHTFRVRHLEHATHEAEVLVPPAGVVVVDVSLQHRPILLPNVSVRVPARPGLDTIPIQRDALARVIDREIING